MKKIININLSGRVIPIEDSAYEKLQGYIESLRRYFAHEEGKDEIINDIESRIAELMNEKIRKGAACVTEADIDEIIASMGRPEDFDAEASTLAGEATTSSQSTGSDYSYSERKTRGRLYRDGSDKFIGGVCSGLANYINTDPAIVRLLFAIITFGGFGVGVLIYILMWIILPERNLEGYSGKRLYRNPDDRVIGGVAGGLAAYFNTRTSTIRLIFAAPLLLAILFSILDKFSWGHHDFDFFPNVVFGSITSTFFLAYVILWIVLPEARTSYEKMEMRGEKVDVNTIRQNVREGMGNMKERIRTWGDEVKESAQNFGSKAREFGNTRGREFAADVRETARSGGRGIGHAIGVIFKAFFLFIAGTIAFALFVATIALIFGGIAWWPINNFLWTSSWQQLYAWGTAIFFLLVPLVGFIIWVVRRVMGIRRSRHSYLGWTFGFLWTLGWVSVVLLAASLSRDFSKQDYEEITLPVSKAKIDKMIVTVSGRELEYQGNFDWISDDGDGWDLSEDTLKLSTVGFSFDKSLDGDYHVMIRKYSHGRNLAEARSRAARVQYDATVADSILDLGSGYAIDKDSKFRGQQVEVRILVPVGKRLRFDRSVNERLNPNFHFRMWRWDGRYRSRQYDDMYTNRLRDDVDYVMDADGNLRDVTNGTQSVRDGEYRYQDRDTNNTKTESLEERERRWKEEGKKIDAEKKKQQGTNPGTTSIGSKHQYIAHVPTPGFSIVKSYF